MIHSLMMSIPNMETTFATFLMVLQSKAAHDIAVGVLTAASADYLLFRQWKKWEEATTFDWKTASWRWFQGAIVGFVSGSTLNALLGSSVR